MVAKCGNASCSSVTLRTLDATGDVGRFTSITIGADGFPVIAYYDYTNEDLKVAKCGDASCSPGSVTLRTLDSTGNVGYDASITIGADGFPIISYRDLTNQNLKVAKCGDASCSPGSVTLRTLDTAGEDVGGFTSITIGWTVSRSSPIMITPMDTLRWPSAGTPPAPPLPGGPWMPPGKWAGSPRSPSGRTASRSSPTMMSPIPPSRWPSAPMPIA